MEISVEYVPRTKEEFYPSGTTDGYFEAPCGEHIRIRLFKIYSRFASSFVISSQLIPFSAISTII